LDKINKIGCETVSLFVIIVQERV